MRDGKGFADDIGGRITIVSVDLLPKEDEPEKVEGKVVCEIDITEGVYSSQLQVHIEHADLRLNRYGERVWVHTWRMLSILDRYVCYASSSV